MQHNPNLLFKVNTSCYNLTLKTYAKLKKKHEFYTYIVAANEHQGSMKYQENRDRRKMPTKSRGYITGT